METRPRNALESEPSKRPLHPFPPSDRANEPWLKGIRRDNVPKKAKKRMLNGSERMCSGTRECNKCKCIEIISMYGARIEQIVTLIWPVRLEKQVLQSARNLNTDFPRIGNQS